MFLSFAVVILLFVMACLVLSLIFDIIAVALLKKRYALEPTSKTEQRIGMYRRSRRLHILLIGIVCILIIVCSFIGVRI